MMKITHIITHVAGEGLIRDQRLKDAYKKRLEYIITHRNSVNGRIYRDDTTIFSWVIATEPILAPPTDVTLSELRDWIEEMALYTKSLDPNHLVSINLSSPMARRDDWLEAVDVPALDYIYAEYDGTRFIRLNEGDSPQSYLLKLHSLRNPVVPMLSFTSEVWDLESMGTDYIWQANNLHERAKESFEAGAAGVVVCTWGSALCEDIYRTYMTETDLLFNYDITNEPIVTALKEIAAEFDTLDPTVEP